MSFNNWCGMDDLNVNWAQIARDKTPLPNPLVILLLHGGFRFRMRTDKGVFEAEGSTREEAAAKLQVLLDKGKPTYTWLAWARNKTEDSL